METEKQRERTITTWSKNVQNHKKAFKLQEKHTFFFDILDGKHKGHQPNSTFVVSMCSVLLRHQGLFSASLTKREQFTNPTGAYSEPQQGSM